MEAQKCSITKIQKYALIDSDGDIRATAYTLEDAIEIKKHNGWGKIVYMKYDGKTLKLGKEIK